MHLLESFVVNKAGCILRYVKLALLDVLAELPTMEDISVSRHQHDRHSQDATYMLGD